MSRDSSSTLCSFHGLAERPDAHAMAFDVSPSIIIGPSLFRRNHFSPFDESSLPIWIHFPALHPKYWTQRGLGKLASIIGQPLYMDTLTAEASRLNFAGVCVMVSASSALPDHFRIQTPSGLEIQEVEYEWKPSACKECEDFGHSLQACAQNPGPTKQKPTHRMEWIKKSTPSTKADLSEGQSIECDINSSKPPQTNTPKDSIPVTHPIPGSSQKEPASQTSKDTHSPSQPEIPLLNSGNTFSVLADLTDEENGIHPPSPLETHTIISSPRNAPVPAPCFLSSPGTSEPSIDLKNLEKIIGVWNIRGICSNPKRKEVAAFVKQHNFPICCLLEIKTRSNKLKDYSASIRDGWKSHGNYSSVNIGRIWILWNPAVVDVIVREETSQLIQSEVLINQSKECFCFTAIYAHNYKISRTLWSDLEEIAFRISSPWLVASDFNVVRFSDERLGGTPGIPADSEEFNSCISSCNLLDLKAIGHKLTWNNRAKGGNRKNANLNRVMVNDLWLHVYPLSHAEFLSPGISDHCQATVSLNDLRSLGPKPFKFMNMWLLDTSFFTMVEKAWAYV
ncbi:uncharacterized protein LOC143882465 [Tasmannia lanceolata]|uniref:uncharacterized protein LOC143882465 n=1 Tax=Tasmannia lanceolata TaxID=3420 RepID=UPI0040647127